jgi:glucose/arabinose dehydrogenase
LRKLLIGAVAASVSLAVAAGAVAQAPESTFTAKVSPSNAGTKSKPKNTTLNFNVTLNKPATTVEFIDLGLPAGLKISGKGLKRCSAETLAAEGPSGCPAGSKAGPTGSATAVLGTGPTASDLNFEVSPFVLDSNTLVFYVASEAGTGVAVQSPITGEITGKGRKLRIRIPQELRQPVPGVDASLTSLNQTFKGKVGKNYVVSSTGCKNKKHKFTGKLTFTNRADLAPVPGPVSLATSARCSK